MKQEDKNEVQKMIKEEFDSATSDIIGRLVNIERTLSAFGGEEYSNLSSFSKPMELSRSLRLLAYTPAQITADQNNYDTADSPVLRLSSDASRNITGFDNGYRGKMLLLINVGGQNIVLKDESASSSASNRIACSGSADITLNAEDSILLWYDVTSLRWRTISL